MKLVYSELCENCEYQKYEFLRKYDTICPFLYDFRTCYINTKGNINEIKRFDRYIEENAGNNLLYRGE